MKEANSYSASGTFGKVVAYRLLPGTDFMTGIRDLCDEHGIRHGALLSATGSLQKATFMVAAPNEKAKLGSAYSEPSVKTGPIEVLTVQGMILEDEGKVDFHIHGSFSDKDLNVFGGHLVEGENPVLVTMEGVVAELSGPKLGRRSDEQVGGRVFHPVQG